MAEHMRRDQYVLRVAVVACEVGAPGVAGEHDLEQAREPHPVLHQPVDVAHAERPVRHADRQPVDGDLHHHAVRHGLELDRVILEPRAAGKRLDPCEIAAPAFAHRGSLTRPSPGRRNGARRPTRRPSSRPDRPRCRCPSAASCRKSRPTSLDGPAVAARPDLEEAAVAKVGEQSRERCVRRRAVAWRVLPVGGVEEVQVVLRGIEPGVDDLPRHRERGGHERSSRPGDLEELLLGEFPGFRGVRDEHHLEMPVLPAQALHGPEEERLRELAVFLAHAGRDVEHQEDHGLGRGLLALRELAITQVLVGEGRRILLARLRASAIP